MTLKQRLDQLEKRNKRLTVALTLMAVAVCAVVTLAATNIRDVSKTEIGRFVYQTADANNFDFLIDTSNGDMWKVLIPKLRGAT